MYFEENWLNPIGAFHPIIRLARILIRVVHVNAMSEEYNKAIIAILVIFFLLAVYVIMWYNLNPESKTINHTPHEFKDLGVFDQDVTFSDRLNEDEYCSIYDCSNGYDP